MGNSRTIQNICGQKFGILTAVSISYRKGSLTFWLCRCDCGNEKTVYIGKLKNGWTKSCGCLRLASKNIGNKAGVTHGLSNTSIYKRWEAMIARCHNPNNRGYKNYGGRGITVSSEWHRFEQFFEDVGHPPFQGAELDRRDNNKGYSKDNCRWVSHRENCLNTRRQERKNAQN